MLKTMFECEYKLLLLRMVAETSKACIAGSGMVWLHAI